MTRTVTTRRVCFTAMFVVTVLAGVWLAADGSPRSLGATTAPVSPRPPLTSQGSPLDSDALFLPVAHAMGGESAAPTAIPFAPYVPVPVDVVPNVPPYEPDLSELVNRGAISRLTAEQRDALEVNGFVVVPRHYEDFWYVYALLDKDSQPAFVTTDALLHAFHVAYDGTLQIVEHEHLIADAGHLTRALLWRTEEQLAEATLTASGDVVEAVMMNLAYFSVAAKLLDPNAAVHPLVADVVARELALIEAHAGVSKSPIFEYAEDYSQYVPRGHYTHHRDLQRYFRAMMWYGRMAFHLDPPAGQDAGRRETRAALLAVAALHTATAEARPALEVWDGIYDVTSFFVGTGDDLTPQEYAALAHNVYGSFPSPVDLSDDRSLDAFIVLAQRSRKPTIIGTPLQPGDDPMSATHGFRLMGLRYVPDSEVFQQLVYNEVEGRYRGTGMPFTWFRGYRGFPRALDIPAALGSERALEILAIEGDTDYDDYDEQLAEMRSRLDALDEASWTSNLYWSWMHGLRSLLDVAGEGHPFFMQQPAWTDKNLGTYLSSWTQLRRDSVLYAKQCYGLPVNAPPPWASTAGYVEPNPLAFARLAALTAQTRGGLKARELLDAETEGTLARLEAVLLALTRISEKELRGEALTDAEQQLIREIHEPLLSVQGLVARAGYGHQDTEVAVVADVFSHVQAGHIVEAGVGDVFEIFVIVPLQPSDPAQGGQVVVKGGVFSHYEFKWPLSDRLTDDAWRELHPRPAQPAWTRSYIVGQ